MATRKSINFNVSQETYDLVRSIFPDVVGTEDNLKLLLHAHDFYLKHKDDNHASAMQQIEDLNSLLEQKQEQLHLTQNELNAANAELANIKLTAENNDERDKVQHDQIIALEEQNTKLAATISELTQTIEHLESKQVTWEQIRITLQPFTAAMLEETAKRLSERFDREVTPISILVDMFLRYTIERNAEWFYPFVLKERDIVAIAHTLNENVVSINQIKKAILGK